MCLGLDGQCGRVQMKMPMSRQSALSTRWRELEWDSPSRWRRMVVGVVKCLAVPPTEWSQPRTGHGNRLMVTVDTRSGPVFIHPQDDLEAEVGQGGACSDGVLQGLEMMGRADGADGGVGVGLVGLWVGRQLEGLVGRGLAVEGLAAFFVAVELSGAEAEVVATWTCEPVDGCEVRWEEVLKEGCVEVAAVHGGCGGAAEGLHFAIPVRAVGDEAVERREGARVGVEEGNPSGWGREASLDARGGLWELGLDLRDYSLADLVIGQGDVDGLGVVPTRVD